MPRLTPTLANDVNKAAESSGFTPLEPGTYRARLTKVDAKQSRNNNPMWVWEYEVLSEPYAGRKQWNNTVLTDKALWKVAETFAAFGVPVETDTDELIGCTVQLEVTQRTIEAGARAGQIGDNVERVLPDNDPGAIRHASATFGAESSGTSVASAVAAASSEDRF